MARLRGISLHGGVENRDPITVIGQTDFRDHRKIFGIRKADRRAHLYLIGKTGTGKSTLLENLTRQDSRACHGLTLLTPYEGVLRLLDDRTFRRNAMNHVANAAVRDFWLREYESYPARFRVEAIAPIQNKVGAFLTNPILHNIVTQPKSAFDLRRVMDEGKIVLVNLAKGKIGEDVAELLGTMLGLRIGLSALCRMGLLDEQRSDFYVYLDGF